MEELGLKKDQNKEMLKLMNDEISNNFDLFVTHLNNL
jgi:hypothetical protein